MRILQLMLGAVLLVGPATATVISVTRNGVATHWGVGSGGGFFETFGQTITAPADSQLLDFAFLLGTQFNGSGPIPFQAHVFAWDATNVRATGPSLYSSAPSTFTAPAFGFSEVKFSPNITLSPNVQYVLFFSTAGLNVGGLDSTIRWGVNFSNPYSGGQVVFQAGSNASAWTTASWRDTLPALDWAMTVNFGDASVPEPSTYGLCGAALAALGLLRRK